MYQQQIDGNFRNYTQMVNEKYDPTARNTQQLNNMYNPSHNNNQFEHSPVNTMKQNLTPLNTMKQNLTPVNTIKQNLTPMNNMQKNLAPYHSNYNHAITGQPIQSPMDVDKGFNHQNNRNTGFTAEVRKVQENKNVINLLAPGVNDGMITQKLPSNQITRRNSNVSHLVQDGTPGSKMDDYTPSAKQVSQTRRTEPSYYYKFHLNLKGIKAHQILVTISTVYQYLDCKISKKQADAFENYVTRMQDFIEEHEESFRKHQSDSMAGCTLFLISSYIKISKKDFMESLKPLRKKLFTKIDKIKKSACYNPLKKAFQHIVVKSQLPTTQNSTKTLLTESDKHKVLVGADINKKRSSESRPDNQNHTQIKNERVMLEQQYKSTNQTSMQKTPDTNKMQQEAIINN